MKTLLKKFADEEFGNAVLDWAVLACGAAMLAAALVLTVVDPAADMTADEEHLIAIDPASTRIS